jgi:hypothetical protein
MQNERSIDGQPFGFIRDGISYSHMKQRSHFRTINVLKGTILVLKFEKEGINDD